MPSLSFIIDSGILVVTDSIEIHASLLQLETVSLSIIDTASYARTRLSFNYKTSSSLIKPPLSLKPLREMRFLNRNLWQLKS